MTAAIFDTETTGLVDNSGKPLKKQPHVIEFSGLLVEDDGRIVGELDFLCNPGIKIDDEITKITGLKNEDLKDKLPFFERVDEVVAFFSKADVVVAHNLSYDMSLVEFEMERHKAFKMEWPQRKICTVEATEYLKGFRLSLTALHEFLFNEPFTGAHRAMVDVKALTRCYIELLKRGVL